MDEVRTYQVQNPYEAIGDHPAVNVVIGKSGSQMETNSPYEQQKLASQRPRGTRIDPSGTRIQVKGGRNYTSRNLFISREEMFDDVVVRGLRADGLSTKMGVKNNKDGIRKMIMELFEGDSRLSVIEEHFRTHRQKSNCAKTMFATMTHEELQFLKQETFPSRIDVQIRDYLMNNFAEHPQKLQSTVEVLSQIQQIFKAVTPHADFLSSHNFQTRGFFLDIILMTCSFLMQIIQDSDQGEPVSNTEQPVSKEIFDQQLSTEDKVKENKTAAETLLSVGSDIVVRKKNPTIRKPALSKFNKIVKAPKPTTVVVEGTDLGSKSEEEWTTVEMVDAAGNSRCVWIKTDGEDIESIDTAKILNLLQTHGVTWDDKMEITIPTNEVVDPSTSRIMENKQSSANAVILQDVLQNTTDGDLVIDLNIAENSRTLNSTESQNNVGILSKTSISEIRKSNDATTTQQSDHQHQNADELLVEIERGITDTAEDSNKRKSEQSFPNLAKKYKREEDA